MKKSFYGRIVSTITALWVIFACTTHREPFPNDSNGNGFSAILDISEIKSDYDQEMSKVAGLKITGKDKRERTLKRKIRWTESYKQQTPQGEKVIVPFSLEEELYFVDKYGNSTSYGASTFLIVSKKDNQHEFDLATYIPDQAEDPSKITPSWSGQIIVENAQGDFKKAYILDNGVITFESGDQPRNGRVMYQTCRLVEFWQCVTVPSEGLAFPCTWLYNLEICYSQIPPATGTSSNGYLQIIGGIGPSGGGTGGTSGSTSIYGNVVDRVTKITRFTNFTNGQKVWLNDILEELVSKNCLMRAMYSNLVSTNSRVDWYIDAATATPGAYNPTNKKITFQSQQQMNQQTVREELFHRLQDALYPGGISQYVTNGKSNIEFEAKLMRDILGIQTLGGGISAQTVGSDHFSEYIVWLEGITYGGTKYPDNYSDVSSQYFYYLNLFKLANPGYNFPTINTLYPDVLFTLINSSSCPK